MIRLANTGARYTSAVGFVGLATALTSVLKPFITTTPFALFFGAVALTAWSGGLGPGLMATTLSVFCINFFFVAPKYSLSLYSIDVPSMLVFIGIAALISYLMNRREDAEKAAHKTEIQLQRVFDSITEMAFTVDSNWRFLYINKQLSTFTGKSPDYYKGKLLWEEFPSIQGKLYEEKCREAMSTGQNLHFEVKSDFGDRWWQIRVFPHDDQLSVFVSDITETKRSTQTLIDREEQLRLALAGARLGDWEWNVATDKLKLSERGNEIFGLPPEESLSFTEFLEIIHPLDRPIVQTEVRRAVEEKTDYTVEYRAVWPDQSIHWVHARGRTFYDAQGQPMRMRGVVLDITEQKRGEEERAILLENERQARSEAERVSRLKDEFLATLSHELRTPLNAILGWSHLIREPRLSEADKLNGIITIERNARTQVQLIEDLLDMSRIISGKMRLDVQRVNLATIIESAIESVQPAAVAKGIRLQTVLDPAAGMVTGDPGRLQQIVWNLLTNAIKFTPKEGRVQVCLARINSHVEIVVSDSGQGITPEFLPYVFERFRQQDSSTTRRFGGLGLGLGIVHHLIQLHGGSVTAQSPGEGQGATFTVKLPLVAVRENDSSALQRHPDKMSEAGEVEEICLLKLPGIQILVVDDEPDSRELLKRILIECEAQVVTASGAAEALELIAQEKFDVLISDIGMPGEDGYQLMRKIRQYDSGNEENSQMGNKLIPAIALTAYARIEDRRQALLSGFNLHLAKPVEPSELITAVASLAGLIR